MNFHLKFNFNWKKKNKKGFIVYYLFYSLFNPPDRLGTVVNGPVMEVIAGTDRCIHNSHPIWNAMC